MSNAVKLLQIDGGGHKRGIESSEKIWWLPRQFRRSDLPR